MIRIGTSGWSYDHWTDVLYPHDPAVYELLQRYNAAYVVMSGPGLRCEPRATSHLVYVRLHGPAEATMYAGSYPDNQLQQWADQIRTWDVEGHRVVVYFNNDLEGHAVRNARTLKRLLSPRVR